MTRKTRRAGSLPAALAAAALAAAPLPAATRPLAVTDLASYREVGAPALSPDGAWVAYPVGALDFEEDRINTDLWLADSDGRRSLQLTFSKDPEESPGWSPDGTMLSFLSDRGVEEVTGQLWLINRDGGEGRRVTSLAGGVEDYAWSPDGTRIVLVVRDPDPDAPGPDGGKEGGGPKQKRKPTPKPIVINRFQFKQDIDGYLGERRLHLHLLDLTDGKVTQITSGPFDDMLPAWSPDGRSIVFTSKRGPDPDRTDNWDLYVLDDVGRAARGGAGAAGVAPRQLTTFPGPDSHPDWESRPAFSPDGRFVAYLQGGPPDLIDYAVYQVAVVSVAGGEARLLAPSLDRNMQHPRWSSDASSIYFLLEDDGSKLLARAPAGGGAVERLYGEGRTVEAFDLDAGGRAALLETAPLQPAEIRMVETSVAGGAGAGGGTARPVSRHNSDWLAGIELGPVETIRFASRDGTRIHGFVVKPPVTRAGGKHPAILRIHGGPTAQYSHAFMFEWQLLAAQGYLVVAANPRGSSGRGQAFSSAIAADWGSKDAEDVLAAIDHVVAAGLADPTRLGVGGWSYGGMLTNYVIARDTRFAAATSGAGIANILAGYGTDQYVREYEAELGVPWKSLDTWLRISYPFLNADRIRTPTLFLCGEKDFNVPLLNSEQMYQSLRSVGVDTRLVIYPGQHHAILKPSYQRDRYERYIEWYARYLRPES